MHVCTCLVTSDAADTVCDACDGCGGCDDWTVDEGRENDCLARCFLASLSAPDSSGCVDFLCIYQAIKYISR